MSRIAEAAFGDTPYPERPGFTEPTTSREAAVKMTSRAETLRAKVIEHLKVKPSTVHQTAVALEVTIPSIQPRFSELRKIGKIEATGERRKNESGMSAAVWRLK